MTLERERYRIAEMRRSLAAFVRGAWHVLEPGTPLEWSWHLQAICDHVQALLVEQRRKIGDPSYRMRANRSTINVPPGTLKSLIVCVASIAWNWLSVPGWEVICTSGTEANVKRDAEKCHDLITSAWYRETFGITWVVRPDIDSKEKFQTTAGGTRYAKNYLGKFTGLHASAVICDDPDDEHAVHGEPERKKVQGKWRTITNRVRDPRSALLLIVQQRVHVDDLTAHVLSRGGWESLVLPLEFDPAHRCRTFWGWADPRTEPGELLHAARFTPEVLEQARADRPGPFFEAAYNQRPDSLEGGMFARAWLRWWRPAGEGQHDGVARPEGCLTREACPAVPLPAKLAWISISVDATFGSLKDTASRVGLVVVGGAGRDRYVLEDRTRRMTFKDTCDEICSLVEAYPGVRSVLIETKANGAAVIDRLGELIKEGRMRGVVLEALETDGGKAARAAAIVPDVFAGALHLRDGAPWLVSGRDRDDSGFVHEFCGFPSSKHDDRVDAVTQLVRHYAGTASYAWLTGIGAGGGRLPGAVAR